MVKNFYDLDQIRSIPIKEVANVLGVSVNRYNKCKIRDEKTASVQLYTKNSNGYDRFWDFGINEGGDVIVFASMVLGSDWQTALETLAESFGIEPVNNTEYQNRSELTNAQYMRIGVYGDLATKNLDFDLERYSMESAQKYSEKYHMTVNELRKTYPEFYTHKILRGRVLPFVSEMRNSYYSELYGHFLLAQALGVQDATELPPQQLEKFGQMQRELEAVEKLLHKAAMGTSMEETLPVMKYDVKEDYLAVINGKVPFQVGPVSYNDMKHQARANDEILRYRSTPRDAYFAMLREGLEDVPHAAFQQGEEVNLAFLPEHSAVIERFIVEHKEKEVAKENLQADSRGAVGKEYEEKVQQRQPAEMAR